MYLLGVSLCIFKLSKSHIIFGFNILEDDMNI